MTDRLASTTVSSPVGPLTLIASDRGLRAVLWPDDDPQRVPAAAAAHADEQPDDATVPRHEHPVLEAARRQLTEYFDGARTGFDVPLDPVGTEFQQRAWQALRTIPFGSTVSYGEQASRMGDKNKARAVGAANARNPISIIVPCHRVVGANGSLTGFAGGIDTKRFLLEHERRVAGQTLL
jgi:methylated-DNA-[protein]-cysteine S-methyltransferase